MALILFTCKPVWADIIYQWKNKSGITVYSNISPPPGADCRITGQTPIDPATESLTPGPAPSVQKTTEQPSAAVREEHLLKRVQERKTSIEAVEKLIRERPNDLSLRRNLLLKRQHLQNDLNALKPHD